MKLYNLQFSNAKKAIERMTLNFGKVYLGNENGGKMLNLKFLCNELYLLFSGVRKRFCFILANP